MAYVCRRWPAGIAGPNSDLSTDICLLCVLCVVRDLHSSRGVLASVGCLSVIVKPQHCGRSGPQGALEGEENLIIILYLLFLKEKNIIEES